MAKLFLEPGDTNYTIHVADNVSNVYGSSGTESIVLGSGVTNVTINANVEGVQFSGALSDYKFKQTGNRLNVYASDGTTLISKIGLQGDSNGTQLTFTNGTFDAKYLAGDGTLNLTIGGQTVNNSTPTAFYSGHTYYLNTTLLTWQAAETAAIAMGGHLVTINDANENNWLMNNILSSTTDAWIGYYDPTTTDATTHAADFTWIGSSSSYSQWATGEPNNSASGGGREDYAQMNYNWERGNWSDATGTVLKQSIIEITGTA